MSILRIKSDGSETWFLPGAAIAGDASWHLDAPAEAVELRLFWYTEGKGTQDVEVEDSIRIEQPEESGQAPFRFQAPEGPYSFSGRLISLSWAIELVALPSEETERLELVIGPQPVEVSIEHSAEF